MCNYEVTIAKDKNIERVSREIKQYSVADHVKSHWIKTKGLFEEFSQRVLELDARFEVHPVKSHIGFKLGNKNVINVAPGKSRFVKYPIS